MKKLFILVLAVLTSNLVDAQIISKREQMPITPLPLPESWPGWEMVEPIELTTFVSSESSAQSETVGVGYLFYAPDSRTAQVYIRAMKIIPNQGAQISIVPMPMTPIGAPLTAADFGNTQTIRTGQNTYVRVFVNPLTGMIEPKPVFIVRQVRYSDGDPNDPKSWKVYINYTLG